MKTPKKQVIVALDGLPVGYLEAGKNQYQYSYLPEYEGIAHSIPLSYSYPFHKGPWPYAFAGELPPYFSHLLPEGWLKEIADTISLPMENSLEKLATLCRENLGSVEIYAIEKSERLSYESLKSEIKKIQGEAKPSIFQARDSERADIPCLKNCLRCHKTLPKAGFNSNYHEECSLQFFGSTKTPGLDISSDLLIQIARDQLGRHESLTGVQPKFSAIFRHARGSLSDVSYIVKPEPTFAREKDGITYEGSSILELASMHFAELLGLHAAETALVFLKDQKPALVSKRFDRKSGGKIHTEDAAQALSIRHKYQGSHEKIANIIKTIPDPAQREEDFQRFLKVILFNFVIGNSDGHLKNYSFTHQSLSGDRQFRLSPFYDILPVKLFASQDPDELGLTVDGKKSNLTRLNFQKLAIKMGLNVRIIPEFIEEIEGNIDFFYESFTIFGAPKDLVERMKVYCDKQLSGLKK